MIEGFRGARRSLSLLVVEARAQPGSTIEIAFDIAGRAGDIAARELQLRVGHAVSAPSNMVTTVVVRLETTFRSGFTYA